MEYSASQYTLGIDKALKRWVGLSGAHVGSILKYKAQQCGPF